MKQITDMTEGTILSLVIPFAIPLLLTNLGQQFYTIIDAAIVGRGVGVKALAAVGSSDWSYWLILWSVTGVTQGFSTFVSRYFGQKDYARMRQTMAMSVTLCAVIGGILTLCGLLAARPLLVLLHTPEDILDDAWTYLTTMIAGTLVVTAYNMAASILRAFGNGSTPLRAMGIAALCNIGLDVLFVMVFQWGVFGAAIASVFSQLFSFLYCLRQIRQIVTLEKQDWSFSLPLAGTMLKFSLPIALQYIVIALSGIVLQSTLNAQGSTFVAGFTATNKLYGLLESTAISIGLAFATFFSQNYGARQYKRVKDGVRLGLGLCVITALCVIAIILPSGKLLLQAFLDTDTSDGAAALSIAWRYLFVMTVCLVVLYPIHIYKHALQGIGNARWPMLSGFGESLARIGMATYVVQQLGTQALFYVEPIAWIVALLLTMLPYYWYQRNTLCTEEIP